jgi:hypothetical protein
MISIIFSPTSVILYTIGINILFFTNGNAADLGHSSASNHFEKVFVEFGTNLGKTLPERITTLLRDTGVSVFDYTANVENLDPLSLVLAFGNSTLSNNYLSLTDINAEGFVVKSRSFANESMLLMSNGLPFLVNEMNYALNIDYVHYGAAVGAYAALESIGYAFLHPLQPIVPKYLVPPSSHIDFKESPYWLKRTWHIHTQHPLEFTDVLNGYDIPMTLSSSMKDSPDLCSNGVYCESWDQMYKDLPGLFEWLLANRQNRVEILLLGNKKWDAWGDLTSGPMRQERLKKINALSHEFGILIGADIPLANIQQHGWAMINVRDNITKQTSDIEARVDWAFEADYDFISTESGLSEFTKPSCDLMLELFEIFTNRGLISI